MSKTVKNPPKKAPRDAVSREWIVRDPAVKPTRFTVREIRAAVRRLAQSRKATSA
jgi:hypothetical protein